MKENADRTARLSHLQALIRTRKGLVGCGNGFSVALNSRKQVVFAGESRRGQSLSGTWQDGVSVVCRADMAAALFRDGTVRAVGGNDTVIRELEGLSSVNRFDFSPSHAAVLFGNGRAQAFGDDRRGQCRIDHWEKVTDLCCGRDFTVGLTASGQVLATGGNRKFRRLCRSWHDMAGIFTDFPGRTVFGITGDGRLCSDHPLPHRAKKWKNLIFASSDGHRLFGITASGQLLASPVLPGSDGSSAVLTDQHYIACAAGDHHALFLTQDGQVIGWGRNDFGQCDTASFGRLFADFDEFSTDRVAGTAERRSAERDYQKRLSYAGRFRRRLSCGERLTACISADGRVFSSANLPDVRSWQDVCAVSCGNAHILALHTDGHVSAAGTNVGGCCEVGDWQGIQAVLAGKYHSIGLTRDGQIRFAGYDDGLSGELRKFRQIRRLTGTDRYVIGETFDGELRLAGQPPFDPSPVQNDEAWRHPVDWAASPTHFIGLFPDGRVRTTEPASTSSPTAAYRETPAVPVCDTSSWRGVRKVAAGEGFVLGLCYGGHVLLAGRNEDGSCDTSSWNRIVDIACGRSFALGLRSDGRVLCTGCYRSSVPAGAGTVFPDGEDTGEVSRLYPFDTERWEDVLTMVCGADHAVALNQSGQVLSSGADDDGQCSAAHFTLFRDIRQLDGYGLYRRMADRREKAPDRDPAAAVRTSPDTEDPYVRAFPEIGSRFRADAGIWKTGICGSDIHVTVCNDRGEIRTFVPDSHRVREERSACGEIPVMAANANGTVLIDRNGQIQAFPLGKAQVIPGYAKPASDFPDGNGSIHPSGIVFGETYTAVSMTDGTAQIFRNGQKKPDSPRGIFTGISALAGGQSHVIGLKRDGTLVSFPDDPSSPEENPCAVGHWVDVRKVVCAGRMTVALRRDGHVYAAGENTYGQCGVSDWYHAADIAASGDHTVALSEDGRVLAVGRNLDGECETSGWTRVIQVAVLPGLTLGLRSDGRILAAGDGGSLPDALEKWRAEAVFIRSIVCFGTKRAAFVTDEGQLWLYHRGRRDCLIPAPEDMRLFTPSLHRPVTERVMPDVPFYRASGAFLRRFGIGLVHDGGILSDGKVFSEGGRDEGQCDTDAWDSAVCVAAGPFHTAAVLSDGRAVMTGRNRSGCCSSDLLNQELGRVIPSGADDFRGNNALLAEDYALRFAWTDIACGYAHTAAVRSDGRVFAVGENPDGRCDTGRWQQIVSVACGYAHTAALRQNGDCVAVGDNRYGQCDVTGWHGLVAVACGETHTVGLGLDGHVMAVGDNRYGQCDVGDLQDVISVACLPDATICAHADGRVSIRGGSGIHTPSADTLRDVVAVFGCEYRAAALTADGRRIFF